MKYKKKSKTPSRDMRIRVTSTLKNPMDYQKLAIALISIARQQAKDSEHKNRIG
jgi:hypothetical protein